MSAYLRLIARRKDGLTHERAQARLDQITASNVAAAIFSRPHSLPYIFRTRRTSSAISRAPGPEHGRFVNGAPLVNGRRALKDLPARTAESDALSRDLSKRGFRFVGSTICYAFIQAVDLVDDHVVDCFVKRDPMRPVEAYSDRALAA